ncbi:ABC transporter substrate-binding protein [Ornithinibacillus sp. 4-3]|uniref:ABC transporter substrate-binding protein n=1 Tax=Ornithinibacillus sp. 4-3 TaxID=3231488 RepID=A0AB39HQI7_9BACI
MKSKRGILFLFVMLITIFLVACSSNEKETQVKSKSSQEGNEENQAAETGGQLNVVYPQQPPTLDTYINTSRPTTDIAKHIFETLVTTDSDYQVQPMLADSWEQSDDGKIITFTLREGVKFHNGKELKAEDVVASMNDWIEMSGLGKEYFTGASFSEIDEYTVELVMPEPLSTALLILAYGGGNLPAIMPKEIRESADTEGVKEFIGTGPFKFEEWRQDQHLHFTKFDDYSPRSEEADGLAGKKEALVDDLYFLFIADSMTATAGLTTGEYDVFYGIPTENVEVVEKAGNVETAVYPSGILNVVFNKRQGLFTDQKAREAALIGIDKEAIMTASYSSPEFYDLNHNVMPTYQQGMWFSESGKELYESFDTERAKQLLGETNYNGEEIIIIASRDSDSSYNGAVVLQHELKELGLNATLQVYDWATLNEVREDENSYDILFLTNTDKPDPTAHVFLRKDWPGWTDDSKYDEIVDEFRGVPSLEEARALYEDFQTWFYEYIPIIKVGDVNSIYANRTAIKNVQYADGIILWNVSKED